MSTRVPPALPQATSDRTPGLGIGFVLLLVLFAAHLFLLGTFAFPLLADDYLFAYVAHFQKPVPEWAPELLPYWRPLSRGVLLPLALSGGLSGAAVAKVVAFVLLAGAAGLQLATWRLLGARRLVSLALAAAFLFATWQPILVGWASGLQDAAAAFFVSTALYGAVSGRAWLALLAILLGVLSKESAVAAVPLTAVLAWERARAKPWFRLLALAGGALLLVWAIVAWQQAAGLASVRQSGPVWDRLLGPVLTLVNAADLPVYPGVAQVLPWISVLVLLVVGVTGFWPAGERASAGGGEPDPTAPAGAAPVPRTSIDLMVALWLWTWLGTLALLTLAAVLLPYAWSSYLIAPVWPVLVLPIARVRGALATTTAVFFLIVTCAGAAVQTRPVTPGVVDLPGYASHQSPGRFRALASVVLPVQEAALEVTSGSPSRYVVDGLPKVSWFAFGSGLAGALWADDAEARAVSTSQDPDAFDSLPEDALLLVSGSTYGGRPAALPFTEYGRLQAAMVSVGDSSAAWAMEGLARLEQVPSWQTLPAWLHDHMVYTAALRARAAGRDTTHDTLIAFGCDRYEGGACCTEVAAALVDEGESVRARVILERLVAGGRATGNAYFHLAALALREGRTDAAVAYFRQATTLGVTSDLFDAYFALERELSEARPVDR